MANSQLAAIFDALAALEITVDGTTVTGRTLANTSPVINVTPVRVISPLSDKNEGKAFQSFTLAKQFNGTWTVTDLFLLRQTGEGTGLEEDMEILVNYLADYIDLIRANRKLGFTHHVTIEKVDVEVGIYPYPALSDDFYHGCKATLTIREIIP